MTTPLAKRDYDPRAKLILVLGLSSLAVIFDYPRILAPLAVVTLSFALYLRSGVLGSLIRMRRLLWVFLAMGVIQSVFTRGGRPLIELAGVALVTTTGLERGVSIILRILVILVSAGIMTTSNPRDIIQGLYQWRVPYELAFMVAVAIRFLPLMREEAEDTLTALQLRGVRLEELPLRTRIRTYGYLLTPLIAGVLARARQMSLSVEMRGFRAYPRRTSHRTLVLDGRDYLLMIIALLLVSGTFLAHFHPGAL